MASPDPLSIALKSLRKGQAQDLLTYSLGRWVVPQQKHNTEVNICLSKDRSSIYLAYVLPLSSQIKDY